LAIVARAVMVPVLRSTALSMKVSVPSNGGADSSESRTSTGIDPAARYFSIRARSFSLGLKVA